MSAKAALLGLAVAVFVSTDASAQNSSLTMSSQAVLDATDQFARAYGGGAPPTNTLQGGTAVPNGQGSNDLEALVGQFDQNATYAGTLQPFWLRGKSQIQDLWSRYFARYPDRRLIFRDRDVQVFGDASVETGYAEMYMGASATTSVPTFMRYSITRTLRSGQWIIVSMFVDRMPSDQPPPGTMPPWANTPPPTR